MQSVKTYAELLMHLETEGRRYAPGQTIFKEGEPGGEMFVVRSGTVELRVGPHVVETVGAAGVLGEMSLVDEQPRSATAVAGTDTELVAIDEARFALLVQRVPGFALEVMRVMARRLRRANLQAD